MKKIDKKMMERGGLMIEALAMLGLIAVVTPTMYKKSAERTLEVEDINTATTVRTYMNAVEAFMNNEYGTLMAQPRLDADGHIADPNERRGFFYESADDVTLNRPIGSRDFHGNAGDPVLDLAVADLEPYLPYRFNTTNPLYDYGAPQARIVKNGNNLTAFVRFPALSDQANGLGQERTARIASLVGATGGYVLSDGQQARGVGGIWSLDNNNMNALFGGAANPYSLVTASANVAMDVNGGQLDNDKYLQRTREDDTSEEGDELWRNTMRTDLYMGGNVDVSNETQNIGTDNEETKHSIRDIQSLIVGAEKAPLTGRVDGEGNAVNDAEGHQIMDEVTNYGLYIYGTGGDHTTNADAYIQGALQAVANELYVSTGRKIGEGAAPAEGAEDTRYGGAQFLFGRVADDDYNTEIRGNGDIYNMGENGILFHNMMNADDGASVQIGGDYGVTMDYTPGAEGGENVLDIALGNTVQIGEHGKATDGSLPSNPGASFVNIFYNGDAPDEKDAPWGYRTTTNAAGAETEVTDRSLVHDMYVKTTTNSEGEPTTTGVEPNFPVAIGANTKVEGTLAAAQMDTNRLRAANLEAGSEKVGDTRKWLRATQQGVFVRSPTAYVDGTDYGAGPGMTVSQAGILMSSNRSRYSTMYDETAEVEGNGGGAYLIMKGPEGNSMAEIGAQYNKEGVNRGTRVQVAGGTSSDSINFIFDGGKHSGVPEGYKNSKLSLTSPTSTDNQIIMTANKNNEKAGDLIIQADKGNMNEDSEEPSKVRIRNSEVSIDMLGNDLVVQQAASGRRAAHVNDADHDHSAWNNNEFRTIFQGGHVVLNRANLKVYNDSTQGGFSVRGNNDADSGGDSSVGAISDGYVDGEDAKYMAAVHGPMLFTGAGAEKVGTKTDGTAITKDKSNLQYLSVGSFNEDAAVNIVADKDTTSSSYNNVLIIDMLNGKGNQIVGNSATTGLISKSGAHGTEDAEGNLNGYNFDENDSNKFGFRSLNNSVDTGAIYMRRGMIEILPSADTPKGTAHDGIGIVKAGRFVANNIQDDGSLIEVPQLYSDGVYTMFHKDGKGSDGEALKRYDTYMVNPAYTSVMHDIKLTTRGGARLSDILPDFINKGIYVANNTVAEGANNRQMKFTLGSGLTVSGFTSTAAVGDPASPYLGAVPAPQCPPGYGRVITVSPVSFQMAQAGKPRLQTLAGNKRTFYAATEDSLPLASRNEDYDKLYGDEDDENGTNGGSFSDSHDTHYRELQWDTTGVVLKANVSSSEGDEGEKTISNISNTATGSDGTGLMYVDTPIVASGTMARGRAYVLGVATSDTDNLFKPLTFQQSTFLKTAAVPLVSGCQTQFGWGQQEVTDNCGTNAYVRAWAILMGFIYPEAYYKTIINELGVDIFSDRGAAGDGTGTVAFYWNVFPAMRESLESYATVYCYYDRTNLYGDRPEGSGLQYVDPYDYLNNPPTGYNRQDNGDGYIERLNDPTMKYNEVW